MAFQKGTITKKMRIVQILAGSIFFLCPFSSAEENPRGLPPADSATYIPQLGGVRNKTMHNQYGQKKELKVLASKLLILATQQEYKIEDQDKMDLTSFDLDMHIELVIDPSWYKGSDYAPWANDAPYGWKEGTLSFVIYHDLVKINDAKPRPRDPRYIVRLEPIKALEDQAREAVVDLEITVVESEDIFSASLSEAKKRYDIVFLPKQERKLFPLFKRTLAEYLQRKLPGRIILC